MKKENIRKRMLFGIYFGGMIHLSSYLPLLVNLPESEKRTFGLFYERAIFGYVSVNLFAIGLIPSSYFYGKSILNKSKLEKIIE